MYIHCKTTILARLSVHITSAIKFTWFGVFTLAEGMQQSIERCQDFYSVAQIRGCISMTIPIRIAI